MNEWAEETYQKFGEEGVEDEKKMPKMGASFSVPSAASVLAPLMRSRVLLGTPFPESSTNQNGWQGSLLGASLHCTPKEGKVLLKRPKQGRDDDDDDDNNVLLVLIRAMSSRCLRDQDGFLRGKGGVNDCQDNSQIFPSLWGRKDGKEERVLVKSCSFLCK